MKTKLIVVLTVLALFVAACGAAGSPANPQGVQSTYTALPTYTAYPTQPAPATESATPIPPTATLPATPTLAPTLGVAELGTPGCQNHGTVAWQNDNRTDGGTYGESPVGGLDEACWVVGQGWYKDANGTPHRFLIGVKPNSVSFLSGFLGGTGWYFSGTQAQVEANLAEQARQLEERDGKMDTIIVILPDDAGKLPIVTRTKVKP